MAEQKAPDSYVDSRRPELAEAMQLEFDAGKRNVDDVFESLKAKGYFTPRPRPWRIGAHERGLGRIDYAVLDRFGDLVVKAPNCETAELIILAVNAFEKPTEKKTE